LVEPFSGVYSGGRSNLTLSVDSQDTIHIVYGHPTEETLKHAHKTQGNTWFTEQVDGPDTSTVGIPYAENAVVIDAEDVLHIGYIGDGNDLYYATNPGGVWSTQLIAGATNGDRMKHPSIALDSAGAVHISY
jgi:hypothetical protein